MKNKRGISAVMTTVLLIILIVAAITIIWALLIPMINNQLESAQVTAEIASESIEIENAEFIENDTIQVTVQRGNTKLIDIELENITENITVTEENPVNMLLLVDLSESMDDDIVYACKIGSLNLNYSGSFCDSGSYLCLELCDGDSWNNYVCANPSSYLRTFSCLDHPVYCANICLGEASSYGTKLEILKNSTNVLIETLFELSQNSKISIMGFSNSSTPDNYFINFSNDKEAIMNELNSWESKEEDTYLSYALAKTQETFESIENENSNVLVILGDGSLYDWHEEYFTTVNTINLKNNINTTIHTIGFGNNADISFLTSLSDIGEGNYYDSTNASNLTKTYKDLIYDQEVNKTIEKVITLEGDWIEFSFMNKEGNSYSKKIYEDVPGAYEKKTYTFELEENWEINKLAKIEIYVVATSAGGIRNSVLVGTYTDFD